MIDIYEDVDNEQPESLRPKIYTQDLKLLVEKKATGQTTSHHIVECPGCAEILKLVRYKLYILKDFSVGYCHRCHSIFHNEESSAVETAEDKMTLINEDGETLERFKLETIDTSYYLGSSLESAEGIRYLADRYPELSVRYKEFGIRFRRNKVVIPFYYNDALIYYQIRYIKPVDDKRYHSPPISAKPLYIIRRPGSRKYMIVEGVFGAIAASFKYPDVNIIAVLGSYLTNYQLWWLESLGPTCVYLYMDDKDNNETMLDKLLKRSPYLFNWNNVQLLHSPNGDPEDDYKAGVCPIIITEDSIDLLRKLWRH